MLRPSKWFGWPRSNADSNRTAVTNPHSLEHLKTLYSLLEKNQTVNDNNRTLLVETLRQIAEILIWGDQNDSTVFDFFLEKNMLCFFLRIMKQKCGGYVCTQLLQTLNILFENIKNQTSLYFLLSNNHVNSIIVHKFDFDDEEVMAYYISFLKTLSFKLNNHTIHFFFNEQTADFPLYTEAIKFFNHSEKMVRIAVRTLTLNVFRVRENVMLKFIRDCTAAPYFSNLSWFIGNHVLDIANSLASYVDSCRTNTSTNSSNLIIRLEDFVAEHLDHLHYLNDILRLKISDLNSVLSDNLLHRLIIPLYVHSFLSLLSNYDFQLDSSELSPPQVNNNNADEDASSQSAQSTKAAPTTNKFVQIKATLSPSVALFLLTQAYIIFSYGPLLNSLVNFLLKSNKTEIELNAQRCEFTPPSKSLEAAIEQAISSTANNMPSNSSEGVSNSQSSLSSSSNRSATVASTDDDGVNCSKANQEENICEPNNENSEPITRTTVTVTGGEELANSAADCLPDSSNVQINHGGYTNHQDEADQHMTLTNWCNRPFLLAMLASLNATVGESANVPSTGRNSSRNKSTESSARSSLKTSLANSCHSSSVSTVLPELQSQDDRIILFTLSLISSILSNYAIETTSYQGIFVPYSPSSSALQSESTSSFCTELINSLLLIIRQCCSSNTSIRLVTFELAVHLFKKIVFYYRYLDVSQRPLEKAPEIFLTDHQLALLEQANEDATHLLRQYFLSTETSVFLELFENEAKVAASAMMATMSKEPKEDVSQSSQLSSCASLNIWSHNLHLNLEQLFMDCTLLLPSGEISANMTDSNFYLRLPINDYEKTRYAIQVFFILRRLLFDVRGACSSESDPNIDDSKPFDLSDLLADSTISSSISLDHFIDLENCDLNACSVKVYYPINQNRSTGFDYRSRKFPMSRTGDSQPLTLATNRKMSLFMAIIADLVILIEPDEKRYGWGVIRFVARLQDMELLSNLQATTQLTTPPIPEKEKDENRSIYVYFRRHLLSATLASSSADTKYATSISSRRSSLTTSSSIIVRFTFDDPIRSLAAKNNFTKAKKKVLERKMSNIGWLIDLKTAETGSGAASAAVGSNAIPAEPQMWRQHYTGLLVSTSNPSTPGSNTSASRKKPFHPMLSRTYAIPGVAMPSKCSPGGVTSNSAGVALGAANKFEMLNKKRYAYPPATSITTSAMSGGRSKHGKQAGNTSDTERKRKKKSKYPSSAAATAISDCRLMVESEEGIPLNDLSPKTDRKIGTVHEIDQNTDVDDEEEDGDEGERKKKNEEEKDNKKEQKANFQHEQSTESTGHNSGTTGHSGTKDTTFDI